VIYLIEKEGKALLYANDTGYFPDSTWEYLAKRGIKLDLVSYDCTYGTWDRGRVTHMHLPLCREVRARLAEEGLLKDDTRHILTHFSHRDGGCGYEKFAPIAEAEGFTVAYDGLEIEF
jgi:phosphoribosyl 1,2-cyclic phosphate phosphodiesterase